LIGVDRTSSNAAKWRLSQAVCISSSTSQLENQGSATRIYKTPHKTQRAIFAFRAPRRSSSLRASCGGFLGARMRFHI
jgi:hypothetical protein